MTACYAERFGSPERLPAVPDSPEDLVAMTTRMVNITVHDEKIIMTRRALTPEQFRSDRARGSAAKHFLTGLTDKGLLRKDDPGMLAFSYTAPISALIRSCGRGPEKTEEAIVRVEMFRRHFVKTYGV